ncbi:hypothetical protein ACFSC3_05565 [Sphingomonas floccifaciens]|uniref:Uncharacterized protein n=1 Tax=Sphingomonas floccifaciens TaxID=1844115 RepID=A0ABW4NA47_9SPHN
MTLVQSPLRSTLILSALLLPVAAVAQDAPPVTPPVFAAVETIADAELRTIAGREDIAQHAMADQVAGVSHNSVGDNVRTGDARIADNALQNLSGLSILNVNTGNNVAINAAMNVNIAIMPPRP